VKSQLYVLIVQTKEIVYLSDNVSKLTVMVSCVLWHVSCAACV